MDKISVFGGQGFIGSTFANAYPEETIVVPRSEVISETPNILFMRSTVHNYHPKEGEPFLDIETNLLHFMKVLSENHKKWGSNMVFNLISTWFVYGNTHLPAQEDSACNPTGFYSITARAREQLLISYCQTFSLHYRIVRLGNVIGIGDQKISAKKNALQWMVRELTQGREINLYKNGAIRDFIDVRDCVSAIHLVLKKGELNQIYNIANGKGLRVEQLIETARHEMGYTGKINYVEVPEFHKVVQTPIMWIDNTKIKKLGYVQQYDIAQSIRGLVAYYKEHES